MFVQQTAENKKVVQMQFFMDQYLKFWFYYILSASLTYLFMLTKKEIDLIKKSWTAIGKVSPVVASDLFYDKLFIENPELRRIFPADMELQYRKLLDMLQIIIDRLENLDELRGDIAAMAKRHVDYGVKPEHYNMVGKALLWTLQKCLCKDWNDEMRSAWINCYAILSGTMITAAAK